MSKLEQLTKEYNGNIYMIKHITDRNNKLIHLIDYEQNRIKRSQQDIGESEGGKKQVRDDNGTDGPNDTTMDQSRPGGGDGSSGVSGEAQDGDSGGDRGESIRSHSKRRKNK